MTFPFLCITKLALDSLELNQSLQSDGDKGKWVRFPTQFPLGEVSIHFLSKAGPKSRFVLSVAIKIGAFHSGHYRDGHYTK